MDKLEEIKKKIEEIQARSVLAPELKQFATLILSIVKKSKDELTSLSAENIQKIQNALAQIEAQNTKLLSEVTRETAESKKDMSAEFSLKIEELKSLMAEIMLMKPKDGEDAVVDEEQIVKDVLSKIEFPKVELDDRTKIIEKINLGGEIKIEAKQISGLPNFTREIIHEVGGRSGAYETPLKDANTGLVFPKDSSGAWLISAGGGEVFHDGTLSGKGTEDDPLSVLEAGLGTVTSVSVVTANGVSGSVANPTTTPAITLTLGAITPTSVAASGTVTGSNLSGTNTGNQTITLTGDVTGSGTGTFAATLATVNSNVGSFTAASITVNAKGLITAASSGSYLPLSGGTLTGALTTPQLIFTQSVLTYGATTNIDFDSDPVRTLSLTGDVTFTTSNRGTGKSVTIKILCDASIRTFTFPSWIWMGAAPLSIAANKTATLTLYCSGSTDASIVAFYNEQDLTFTIPDGSITYAKIQNISATQRVLGRNSAGAGVTQEVTATQVLDWIGSTQGQILYRNATVWTTLATGTAGQVLQTGGAGANPSWLTLPSGLATSGSAYAIIGGSATNTTNGTALTSAYTTAKSATPGGAALSASNRYTIYLLPGVYDLGSGALTLDAQYIDIVGISTNSGQRDLGTAPTTDMGETIIKSSQTTINININANTHDIALVNLCIYTSDATQTYSAITTVYSQFGTDLKVYNCLIVGQSTNSHTMPWDKSVGGIWVDTRCYANRAFGKAVFSTLTVPGTFIRCIMGPNSMSGGEGGTALTVSGTLIDCWSTGTVVSVGRSGDTLSGTFVRVRGAGSGGVLGGAITTPAVVENCYSAGALTYTSGTIVESTFAGVVENRGVSSKLGGNMVFATDNASDIGASGATRPRTGYFGTSVITPLINVTGLTASQIAGTDGSKNIVSLATATYPSLTELTYVKGVTSAIQTQIDTKVKVVKTQIFTSSGTYTPSTGMLHCTVEVQAPGGGGGGVVASSALNGCVGGGGGGGGYARKTFTAATIGASQTVTIGAVGTAGANTGGNGGTGGTTSVGSLISATGGAGGTGCAALGTFIQGLPGAGGVGSNGDININGGTGGLGVTSTDKLFSSPFGGDSYFCGVFVSANTYGTGNAGLDYGGGGTGAVSWGGGGAAGPYVGGTGGAGIIVITEYCNQ